jgi:hypothetical protein
MNNSHGFNCLSVFRDILHICSQAERERGGRKYYIDPDTKWFRRKEKYLLQHDAYFCYYRVIFALLSFLKEKVRL